MPPPISQPLYTSDDIRHLQADRSPDTPNMPNIARVASNTQDLLRSLEQIRHSLADRVDHLSRTVTELREQAEHLGASLARGAAGGSSTQTQLANIDPPAAVSSDTAQPVEREVADLPAQPDTAPNLDGPQASLTTGDAVNTPRPIPVSSAERATVNIDTNMADLSRPLDQNEIRILLDRASSDTQTRPDVTQLQAILTALRGATERYNATGGANRGELETLRAALARMDPLWTRQHHISREARVRVVRHGASTSTNEGPPQQSGTSQEIRDREMQNGGLARKFNRFPPWEKKSVPPMGRPPTNLFAISKARAPTIVRSTPASPASTTVVEPSSPGSCTPLVPRAENVQAPATGGVVSELLLGRGVVFSRDDNIGPSGPSTSLPATAPSHNRTNSDAARSAMRLGREAARNPDSALTARGFRVASRLGETVHTATSPPQPELDERRLLPNRVEILTSDTSRTARPGVNERSERFRILAQNMVSSHLRIGTPFSPNERARIREQAVQIRGWAEEAYDLGLTESRSVTQAGGDREGREGHGGAGDERWTILVREPSGIVTRTTRRLPSRTDSAPARPHAATPSESASMRSIETLAAVFASANELDQQSQALSTRNEGQARLSMHTTAQLQEMAPIEGGLSDENSRARFGDIRDPGATAVGALLAPANTAGPGTSTAGRHQVQLALNAFFQALFNSRPNREPDTSTQTQQLEGQGERIDQPTRSRRSGQPHSVGTVHTVSLASGQPVFISDMDLEIANARRFLRETRQMGAAAIGEAAAAEDRQWRRRERQRRRRVDGVVDLVAVLREATALEPTAVTEGESSPQASADATGGEESGVEPVGSAEQQSAVVLEGAGEGEEESSAELPSSTTTSPPMVSSGTCSVLPMEATLDAQQWPNPANPRRRRERVYVSMLNL